MHLDLNTDYKVLDDDLPIVDNTEYTIQNTGGGIPHPSPDEDDRYAYLLLTDTEPANTATAREQALKNSIILRFANIPFSYTKVTGKKLYCFAPSAPTSISVTEA